MHYNFYNAFKIFNMKKVLASFFFLIFISTSSAQSKNIDYSNVIKAKAEEMGQSLLNKDFEKLVEFTYPKLIEFIGGKQKMIESLKKVINEMNANGVDFIKISFENPTEIIVENNELQSILPQRIEMKMPNGRLISNSSLIAISKDNGVNWFFIDASSKTIQTLKSTFSNLSEKLKLPEPQKPIFIEE